MTGNLRVKKLSTGETGVFATGSCELILIAPAYEKDWIASSQDLAAAQTLVRSGKAREFKRHELQVLMLAMKDLVLLS
jgi:hypothetical protein